MINLNIINKIKLLKYKLLLFIMELDILEPYENYYTSKLNLKWGGKTNFF